MSDIFTFPCASSHAAFLGCDEVHIWLSSFEFTTLTINKLKEVLSKDELQKSDEFHFIKHSEEYIYGRGLLRHILGHYTKIQPENIIFSYNEYGKPFIDPATSNNLKFNVSHSNGLIVFAMTRNYEMGIDIEYVDYDLDIDEIRRNLFPASENKFIDTLQGTEKRTYFYKQWTRNEAYLKGLGYGFGTDNMFLPYDLTTPVADFNQNKTQTVSVGWIVKNVFLHDGYSSAIAVNNVNARLVHHLCSIKY